MLSLTSGSLPIEPRMQRAGVKKSLDARLTLPGQCHLPRPIIRVRVQGGGAYYPPPPSSNPGYDPYAASAPPLPPGTPVYENSSESLAYSSGSAYTPSEAEQEEAQELEQLREAAGATKTLSFLGFWAQLALSVVSAGILLFSVAFVPKVPGMGVSVDISKYLTLVGVIAAFISSLFAHGFLTLSEKLLAGGAVARSYLVSTLLTNNAICLAGIGITVVGLQASVGTLVGKTLMTAVSGPVTVSRGSSNALVSLDVFCLQASTNVLLCHVIGLLFTNLILRMVNKPAKPASRPEFIAR